MVFFLRLFPAFRELQASLAAVTAALDSVRHECDTLSVILADLRARLEDERKQNRELMAQVSAAQRSEIDATRKMADSLARRYSGPIFDLASELPVRPESYEPIPKQRPQGTAVLADMERQFEEELKAFATRK